MKEHKILVAYATKSGSTQEIAQFVTTQLNDAGVGADLRACRAVDDLAQYRAVVLGAPLYMFHLHRDALRFLHRHRKTLVALSVAVFAGGPYGTGAEEDWREVRRQLDVELANFPWLQPVRVEVVGGRFDPALLRFPFNLIPALKFQEPSDLRNWDAIGAWVRDLVDMLDCPTGQRDTAERKAA